MTDEDESFEEMCRRYEAIDQAEYEEFMNDGDEPTGN